MSDDRTVYERWAAVMEEVQAVKKTGHNAAQNFNFRGVDAVVNAAGPAMRKHGVMAIPSLKEASYRDIEVGKNRTQMREVTVKVKYCLVGIKGDVFEHPDPDFGVVPGESMDSGDKGTAKAMSVAERIFLLQALMIPTDEPDPDESSYERAAKPKGSACPKCGEVIEGEGREPLRSHLVELHEFVRQADGTVVAPPKEEDPPASKAEEIARRQHDRARQVLAESDVKAKAANDA